jgi:cytochrome c oxidase cbb3-type subunit III
MFDMPRLAAMALIAMVAAASCGRPVAVGGERSPVAPEHLRQGKALYDRYCALCHGVDAIGYAADNASQLRNPSFLRTASDEFLRVAIDRGRPGTSMSAFGAELGGPLDTHQVDRIIGYLRSLDDGEPLDVRALKVRGDAERGALVYREHCASCHGEQGEGKSAISLNNPTFLTTASAGFIRHAVERGRPGTPMPAFGGTLTPAEIDDVTVAIRRWLRADYAPASSAIRGKLPGLDQLVVQPDGPQARFSPRDGRFVPVDEVAAALAAGARLVLLDARPLSDWHRGHIPGAYPLPFYADIDDIARALPRDGTWVIAYCACPHAASGKVVDALRARGISTAAILDEGILVWERRGHPMQVTAAEPAK